MGHLAIYHLLSIVTDFASANLSKSLRPIGTIGYEKHHEAAVTIRIQYTMHCMGDPTLHMDPLVLIHGMAGTRGMLIMSQAVYLLFSLITTTSHSL